MFDQILASVIFETQKITNGKVNYTVSFFFFEVTNYTLLSPMNFIVDTTKIVKLIYGWLIESLQPTSLWSKIKKKDRPTIQIGKGSDENQYLFIIYSILAVWVDKQNKKICNLCCCFLLQLGNTCNLFNINTRLLYAIH